MLFCILKSTCWKVTNFFPFSGIFAVHEVPVMENWLEDVSVIPSFGFRYKLFCQLTHTYQEGF